MSTWFHTALGKYDISNRWIGLDYAKLLADPMKGKKAIELILQGENISMSQVKNVKIN